VAVVDTDRGLLVRPDVAQRQLDAETPPPKREVDGGEGALLPEDREGGGGTPPLPAPDKPSRPKRYHGTVTLDSARVGRDASRIADEVIGHLVGLVGTTVRVTLEIEAEIPGGASDQVVRIVIENGRTLKFTSQGFEAE